MKALIEISNRFYAKVLDEFYTHADLIDGMNAIRDGQILPGGCEILTKEAYEDLCLRASKGNCSEIPIGSEKLSSELEKNSKKLEKDFGESDCISRADAIHAVSEALKHTFVEYEDIANKVIGKLPSVTPQELRTFAYNNPMQVELEGDGYADGELVYDYAKCPKCGWKFEESDKDWEEPYCCHCGQRLKWFENIGNEDEK